MLLFSCQKEVSTSKEPSVFNPAAAKEWYYAEFKKSTEWQGSDMKGKKLPDWSSGVYKKIGNYEVVEFPLIKATKRFELIKDNSISAEDTRRIMESSVNSILFIRSGKQIFVREVQYIPALHYLTASNFDISRNKISAIEKTFSGQIVVKKWNGIELGRNVLANGKITKKYKLGNVLANRLQRTQSCQVGQLEITEWARDCEVHIYGDGMVTNECGQWYTTGNTWCVDDENGQNPNCTDPSTPECFCELIGGPGCQETGGGNNGDPEADYDTEAEAELTAQVFDTETNPETESINFTSPLEASKPFQWVVIRNRLNIWQVISSDIAVGYNSNNTGAIIYRIDHQGSQITGTTQFNRIPRRPTAPVLLLINMSWAETSNSSTIASNYKSGVITVSGFLYNFNIPLQSVTQSCTVNAF